jgi:anti-sigma regulatory factor (Ser/Thr protein kinase)
MDLDLDIARDLRAPSHARREVAGLGEGLDEDLLDDVKLLVSELVSNAVKYGRGASLQLRVRTRGRRQVRIEVVDEGSGFSPDIRQETHFESAGLGFRLVERLASRWGIHEGCAHVWFEIDRSGDREAAAA